MIFQNQRDRSGMFSKTGKNTFVQNHIFHKKDEIINPGKEKKKFIPFVNVIEQLEEKFGHKLDQITQAQTTEEEQVEQTVFQRRKMVNQISPKIRKKKEPFSLMKSRIGFDIKVAFSHKFLYIGKCTRSLQIQT